MAQPCEVLIGRSGGECIRIKILGRMHPGADDYWDGNWLTTPVVVRAGGFSGSVDADLRADEFRRFRQELETMYSSLEGKATLASLDGWIAVHVECQANGALDVRGFLNDDPGTGNELDFALPGLDQSDLPTLIAGLQECEATFPVLGLPGEV